MGSGMCRGEHHGRHQRRSAAKVDWSHVALRPRHSATRTDQPLQHAQWDSNLQEIADRYACVHEPTLVAAPVMMVAAHPGAPLQ